MLKKIVVTVLLVGVVVLLAVGAYNRTLAKSETAHAANPANGWRGQEQGAVLSNARPSTLATGGQADVWQGGGRWAADTEALEREVGPADANPEIDDLPPADPAGVSAAEAAALLYMREEEKLARDLYNALAARWDISTFARVAQSEQSHMEALQVLLDRYGLADPASPQVGVFGDPSLQALYDQLLARGSASLSEALMSGGAVEEIDILNLQARLDLTDNADVRQVFENLIRGSENHLRAYARALERQTGEVYRPQYLSTEAYQAIVESAPGNGRRGGRWG